MEGRLKQEDILRYLLGPIATNLPLPLIENALARFSYNEQILSLIVYVLSHTQYQG